MLLLFPPVWSPVMPFLALPQLKGFLVANSLNAQQWDLSIDFFMDYLLTPNSISKSIEKAKNRAKNLGYVPDNLKKRLEDFLADNKKYESIAQNIDQFKSILRDKVYFFEIEKLLNSQSALYNILELISISTYPLTFTFNTLSNHEVTDFDSIFRFFKDENNVFADFYERYVLERIKEASPKIIGISISTSHQMLPGLTLSWLLKKHLRDSIIVLGGRQVDRLWEIFSHFPEHARLLMDMMVVSDGEPGLLGIFEWVNGKHNLEDVPNTISLTKQKVIPPKEIKHLPITERPLPDFDGIPFSKYLSPHPLIPIRLSEGCYWGKCTFCSRYDNRRYKTISPEAAFTIIETLAQRYNTQYFMINDDCLTPVYLEKLARCISESRLKPYISIWAKPVAGFTAERLRLLSKAGIKLVRWGIETGNERILKLMNKGTNIPDTLRVLKDSAEAGIWNHGMFILGFPTETEEEAKETVKFLELNSDKIHSAIFFKFSLLKHSHIYNNKSLYSIKDIYPSSNAFSYEYQFTCSKGMTSDSLKDIFSWAQRYRIQNIYSHPAWFYMRIREYLFLYLSKFDVMQVQRMKVRPKELTSYRAGSNLTYYFKRGEEIDDTLIERLKELIGRGGEVGGSWIKENLQNALLVAYVEEEGKIVATMSHKRPKEKYLKYLRQKTGLDLSGYIERGYSYVRPEYRGLGIGDKMLKGLVERTPHSPIYVTIRLDNISALRLTEKNAMKMVATFTNERTDHLIGIFVNEK